MRILIFTTDFFNGFESFIKNHYEALSKSHNVSMVFLTDRADNKADGIFLRDNSHLPSIRAISRVAQSFPFLNSVLLRNDLNKVCEEQKPDILHFHFGSRAVKYFDQYRLDTTKPIFITFHGIDASHFFKTSYWYRIKIKALFAKDNVYPIFVSQALVNNAKQYNLVSARSQVIYLGVDCDFFKPSLTDIKTNEPKIFLQIARLVSKKGQLIAIRAFKKIHQGLNAELHIVGSGPAEEELQQEIEKLQLSNVVKMFPACTKGQVKEYLENGNFFVHPSCEPESGDMEGLPTVIMEAMAMGLPILSTYHSGIPELVEDGVNGFLCAENDVDHLAKNMQKIWEWGYMQKNREKVIRHFNVQDQNEMLMKQYQAAIRELAL